MSDLVLEAGSALWLGILTSISPCPLATNIAAVSFLGRQVKTPRHAVAGGVLYSLGRTLAYVALGGLVIAGLLTIPRTSRFLQLYMNRCLGPVLIVAGLFLIDLFRLNLPGLGRAGERMRKRFEARGILGAVPLGALFALSFCPMSAALFFGSLMPIALRFESPVIVPTAYGVGTALPVVVFAFFIAAGAGFVGKLFNAMTVVERWARRVTAAVFIAVGLYMTLAFTLEVL